MFDITFAVPVIMAVVSALKSSGMDSKWAALVSMALGIVAFYFLGDNGVAANVLEGIIAGLTASGLYSGTKAFLTR